MYGISENKQHLMLLLVIGYVKNKGNYYYNKHKMYLKQCVKKGRRKYVTYI